MPESDQSSTASPEPGPRFLACDAASWVRVLRSAAGGLPPLGSRLGAGEVDRPLLGSAHGVRLEVPPSWRPSGFEPRRSGPPSALEVRLWWQVHASGAELDRLLDPEGDGPLLPFGSSAAIEVWTESELCALHALGWLASRERPLGPGPGGGLALRWSGRLDRARLWHLENTQPDNATNRPWAVAVFAMDPDADSQLYAQTLLHNALVAASMAGGTAQAGGLEPLSATILHDAASQIEWYDRKRPLRGLP